MTIDTFSEYKRLTRAFAAAVNLDLDITLREFFDSMSGDPKFAGIWNEIATSLSQAKRREIVKDLRGDPDPEHGRGDPDNDSGVQHAIREWDLEKVEDAEAQYQAEGKGGRE